MTSSTDERIVVYLGMPRYRGEVHINASEAFYSTTIDPPNSKVKAILRQSPGVSATTQCFNFLLAEALAYRDRGEVTHFAMLHSDIGARGPWLDVLYREMLASGADIISTVVAIKDGNGRTSTAIGDRQNRWKRNRYISQQQRAGLPLTFGPEHVCRPDEVLLVNTGMWLADLRKPWWDEPEPFAFRWFDRITRQADGSRVVEFRPEDWEMSYDLQERGAKIAATWAPEAVHYGEWAWANWAPPEKVAA